MRLSSEYCLHPPPLRMNFRLSPLECASISNLLSAAGPLDKFYQRAHRDAGGAFRPKGCRWITPCRARDIQVSPRNVVHAFLHESGRGDFAGFLSAGVLDIVNGTLDLI